MSKKPSDYSQLAQNKWNVQQGDIYQLGEHRIGCGDCTDPDFVAKLMNGRKACLVMADPPYGMGKEKDGIKNDNLYGSKLDTFQMAWWSSVRPYITGNASAYVWGNAPDLWRLWYGSLADSERMTFRNEVVWDKQGDDNPTLRVNGKTFKGMRMYYQSERCLFFMLGEQTKQEWWDGWSDIRDYFIGQKRIMKWSNKAINQILGTATNGGGMASHYFTGNKRGEMRQWTLPTGTMYEKLQQAANGQAFNRSYDDLRNEYETLKKEWQATRAHFDNTHENMTDVWHYPRVTGKARYGHATPKPVAMMERIVKSSSPENGLILSPFLGSGPDLIAAHNQRRVLFGMDCVPKYIATVLERFWEHTGTLGERVG